MRTVAKFQLEVSSSCATIASDAIQIVERWAARKFDFAENGSATIKASGVSALYEKQSAEIGQFRQTTFTILEPVEGGELQTVIRLLETSTKVSFQCILGVGSQSGVAPPYVSLRSPRFIKEVIDLGYPWMMVNSSERVFSRSFPVDGEDIEALESLLSSPLRRLPVVVISEQDGEVLAGDLHERIGVNVCGLAHTVRLSTEASWALTEKLGKEWSCFNGAVRLFWPFRANRDEFRAHPLWTLDWIMSGAETTIAARDRFVGSITRKLIEASTFVADDQCFYDFEREKLRRAAETTRTAAEGSGDFKGLAEAYAAENDILRKQIAEQERELADLRQNVEALTIACRSIKIAPDEATDEAPPATVADAVERAKRELEGTLVIAPETQKDWLDLNKSAGPPEKILRYLRTLGRLSTLLADGTPLDASIPIWLRSQNVDCSVESKTEKDAKAGRAFRTRVIEGKPFECEFHAKPSDGTSPDMCARIYFAVADVAPRIRVGYIGRHND